MKHSNVPLYIGTALLVFGVAGLTLANPSARNQATRERPIEIRFFTIEKAAFAYGNTQKEYFVVNSVAGWENLWKEIYPNDLGRPDLFPVVFASSTAIAVFQGEMPSRGYYIEIEKIVEEETVLRVLVNEFYPGKECSLRKVPTYPFHLVTIPKTKKEIIFETQKKTRECRVVHPHTKETSSTAMWRLLLSATTP